MEQKEVFSVTVKESVPGGVVTEVEEIRAFIPASQLSADYVEDTKQRIGREVRVQVITVDEKKGNLVLSGRNVARKEAEGTSKDSQNRQ